MKTTGCAAVVPVTSSVDNAGIEHIVRNLLAYAANCEVERISHDGRLRDFGIDSVGVSAIDVVLESEVGVVLGMDELAEIFAHGTVHDLIRRVAEVNSLNAATI